MPLFAVKVWNLYFEDFEGPRPFAECHLRSRLVTLDMSLARQLWSVARCVTAKHAGRVLVGGTLYLARLRSPGQLQLTESKSPSLTVLNSQLNQSLPEG